MTLTILGESQQLFGLGSSTWVRWETGFHFYSHWESVQCSISALATVGSGFPSNFWISLHRWCRVWHPLGIHLFWPRRSGEVSPPTLRISGILVPVDAGFTLHSR